MTGKKILKIGLVAVIVLALAMAIVLPACLVAMNVTRQEVITEEVGFNNQVIVSEPLEGKALRLATAAANDGTITVTATVSKDYDFIDDKLTWSLAWANPDSTWASGKDVATYMSIDTSANNHVASLDCNRAFGEPIILTATANNNPSASASTQLDYLKRPKPLKSVTGNSTPEALGFGIVMRNDGYEVSTADTIELNIENAVGTLDPSEVRIRNIEVIGFSVYGKEDDETYNSFFDEGILKLLEEEGTYSNGKTRLMLSISVSDEKYIDELISYEIFDIVLNADFEYYYEDPKGTTHSFIYSSIPLEFYVDSTQLTPQGTVNHVEIDESQYIF